MNKNDRLFDNVDVMSIPEREFRVLNALDVSIHRSLSKYEVIFQIIAQDRVEMNQNLVLLVWELIDWLERTRKILGYGAGLKKKDSAYVLVFNALGKTEDFRHILQHFDNFLNKSVQSMEAPLGAVSAIHWIGQNDEQGEFRILTYNAGTIRGAGVELGGIEIPKNIQDKVDFVTLQLEGKSLNLSEILRRLLKYYEQLKKEIEKKYGNEK